MGLIKIGNVNVFNTTYVKFMAADVYIKDGFFYHVDYDKSSDIYADQTVDGLGRYMIPGLIDIHMHIESSMMTPIPYCRRAAQCGVTTLVAEPHEIANVAGIDGIRAMIDADEKAEIDVFYGISSSVPSTSEELETTGGVLRVSDMEEILENPHVICVGEVMNYRGIIGDDSLVIKDFLAELKKTHPRFVIEGHCPNLVGEDLSRFLYYGIDADHTEHSLYEIQDRFMRGMFVELQRKTVKRDILEHIKENGLYNSMCFVTDDTMADRFAEEGCLNTVVRSAIEEGFPVEWAIYCATRTPAVRMDLGDRGIIASGKLADFVLVENIEKLSGMTTFKSGAEIDQSLPIPGYTFPIELRNTVKVKEILPRDFCIAYPGDRCTARAIEVFSDKTQTHSGTVELPVKAGYVDWENGNVALTAVFERYGKNGGVGKGFVFGDATMKCGAVATTYDHDHHNLLVQGTNSVDMALAANTVSAMGGGMAVAKDGGIVALLSLPIGGILSDEPAHIVGEKLSEIRGAMLRQGYEHYDQIMSLCTLSLAVSPELKITDKGLVDVAQGKIVDMFLS